MDNHERAISAFMQSAAQIREYLEWIAAQVDNLEGHYDPDNLTWANVGDVRRIETAMEELTDTIAMALGLDDAEDV